MKRTLYDSRSIPLDLLFAMSDMPRGVFGDPAPIVAETHDAPVSAEENDHDAS